MRDYGTATWEGGDPRCQHSVSGQVQDSKAPGAITTGQRPGVDASTCRECGASRIDAQLGLEPDPASYVANMVRVFREVWRVLRDDGTIWLNLGDSYAATPGQRKATDKAGEKQQTNTGSTGIGSRSVGTLKPKDLCLIPSRVALALQEDGWWLRSDIIWNKPNTFPESVLDRPTSSYEHIFLLAKNGGTPLIWRARDTGEWSYTPDLSEMITLTAKNIEETDDDVPRWKGFDYFYDAEAIREPDAGTDHSRKAVEKIDSSNGFLSAHSKIRTAEGRNGKGRNKRNVWTINSGNFPGSHFAVFPEEIPQLCILAGSRVGDTVLDPFAGSGTTLKVALELGRKAIGIELNPDYVKMIEERTNVTPGML